MSTEKICYDGIDEAVLIHALYHGTRPLGMGWLHNRNDLTVEDVRMDLGQRDPKYRYHFDYYHGRPLKLSLETDTKTFDPRLYDRGCRLWGRPIDRRQSLSV